MILKLKKSKVDFSKEKDLKDLKNNNDNDIQVFIIIPKKDKYMIDNNYFKILQKFCKHSKKYFLFMIMMQLKNQR